MNTEPIICSGNELAGVLADLRSRGMCVQSLQTGVGSAAGYRVSYFERVPEQGSDTATKNVRWPNRVAARGDRIHDALNSISNFERGDTPDDGSSSKDKQQASGNHSGKVATVPGLLLQDAVRARNAMTRKASGVCAETAALNSLNAGNEPVNSAGKSPKGSDKSTPEEIHADKLASGGEWQTESRVEDCHQHSTSRESRDDLSYGGKTISLKTPRDAEDSRQTNDGEAQRTHPQDCTAVNSIEDRMSALKEWLTANGKLRRSKPSTEQKYVRLPHPND